MATVNLGAIRFNWKGAYNNGTAYVVDDVVSSAGNSYICILASTGNAVSNATYWSIMSSAGTDGTDGTDLTSTITTQGDVLFRDGSGLQRLAKGTASQSLTMNAGATAPEWTTPSAGGAWNFISSATASSSSSVDFTSGIDSTYDMYMFVLSDVSCPAGERLWARTGAGSFDSGSSDYRYHQVMVKDNSTSYAAHASTARAYIAVGSSDGGTGVKHMNGTFSMYNPAGTTFRKLFSMDTVQTGSGNASYSNTGQGMRDSTAAITQVRFMADSGNILNGVFYLYGLSKS